MLWNVGIALLALVLSIRTAAYAREWRSDVALWCYATEMTPRKPRPWVNCGAAIAQLVELPASLKARLARAIWLEALEVAKQSHVPTWDRVAANELVKRNLATLERLSWETESRP